MELNYYFITRCGQVTPCPRPPTTTWRREIKFEELFRAGSDYEKVVSDYCLRDLKNRYKGEEWATDERMQFSVEHVVGDEAKWMITPDGLELIFDSLEIGPPGAGPTRVIVPYAVLRQVIRPEGPLASFAR